MRIAIAWQAGRWTFFGSRLPVVAMTVAFLLAAANLFAATTVNWISGGPNPDESGVSAQGAGYSDGDITTEAEYNTPRGIAVDVTGNYVILADQGNNLIRFLEFTGPESDVGQTFTLGAYVGINLVTNFCNNPVGVAVDSSDNIFVLNHGNGKNGSVLEVVNATGGLITNAVNLTNANGIALDPSDNIYVTVNSNQLLKITGPGFSNIVATVSQPGASLQGLVVKHNGLIAVCDSARNGIYLINPNTGLVTTNAGFHGQGDFVSVGNSAPSNAVTFFQPMDVVESGDGKLIVTDFGNHRVKVVLASGTVNNLYGVTSNDWTSPYPGFQDGTVAVPDQAGGVAARMPFGVAFAPDGSVYVTEDYYHIIRHITGTGFSPPPPQPPAAPADPIATAGYGQATFTWTASAGATNYNVKRSTTSGGETTIASTAGTSYTDTSVLDGTTYYYVVSALNVGGEGPNSIEVSIMPLFSPAPNNLTVTATNFGLISLAWAPSAGATSYNLKRSPSSGGPYATIISTASTSYNDTNVVNGTTYYYVVTAVNAGGENPTNSNEVNATPPLPPVSNPKIGYVTFPPPNFTSVFIPVSSSGVTFNNDVPIVIEGDAGSQTYYTYLNTPTVTNVPTPTSASIAAPMGYVDGLNSVVNYILQQPVPAILPNFAIKAIGTQSGHPNSAISSALFQFVVSNPLINGTNAAQFTVTSITLGAQFYYTTDGSIPNPTNANAVGPITNGATLSLSIPNGTNMTFEVEGFKVNYQPSSIVTNVFSESNFVANTISFGFASGEASSEFVASPGQTFFVPVTLTTLPGQIMYSLQFYMTVTNAGPNPGPAITPNAFGFQTYLEQPNPTNPVVFEYINPEGYDPYVAGLIPFQFVDTAENLIGVGWVERIGETNLYNTLQQDLIKYSQAHDDLFPNPQQPNGVIVGGYSFTGAEHCKSRADLPDPDWQAVGNL